MVTETIPDSIIQLTARSNPTISSELAKSPSTSPEEISARLFKKKTVDKLLDKLSINKSSTHSKEVSLYKADLTEHDLERALKCGQFGDKRPSTLFLSMYTEALRCLEHDPLAGIVSPSLLGSTGVMPLSIISVIPDIITHYADVIVRAEKEVFFATNFWESSESASHIVDAFKEMSRRVGERGGEKVVIKLIYDRGTPKQVISNHQPVDEKDYTGERVKLPHPDEIPNLELQVVNYHSPPVGTFHSKYLVVDRRIALINSNNIQDRVNVEMMTHLEGPIVNSFYDMALLCWNNALEPPLPCLTNPPPPQTKFDFGDEHQDIQSKDIEKRETEARQTLKEHHEGAVADGNQETEVSSASKTQERVWDADNSAEAERVKASLTTEQQVTDHLNTGTKIDSTEPSSAEAEHFKPHIVHSRHDPVPMALVNRGAVGTPTHKETNYPQDAAFLAAFKYAQKKVFIQTPTFNAPLVVEAALDAVRRGIEVTIFADLWHDFKGFNDEGELLPRQGGTNEMVAEGMYKKLDNDEQKKLLRWAWYTGKDQAKPLNASEKSRNCHVKLMIVDDQVGIQGNGNQDVQSWYHSCEINVMVDSASICREWQAGIKSNQNTHLHGWLDNDGIWRDKEGKTLPGATGAPHGPFKSLAGVKGAVQRVRGEGGF